MNWLNIIPWLAGFALLFAVNILLDKKAKLSFSIRVFIAMILGMGFGLLLHFSASGETAGEVRRWLSLIGYGYVDLLRMLIIPLVPTSIIVGMMKLKNSSELKELGGRTIGIFLSTATVASILELVVGSLLKVGKGIPTENLASRDPETIGNLLTKLRGFIPKNPLNSAANTEMVPLVVFALFVGIAAVIELGRDESKVEPFRRFMESLLSIVIRVAKIVIGLTPYGVLGLMSYWMSYTGIAAISDLSLFVIAMALACIIHVVFVYGGILLFVPRINPLKFFRAASPAMMLAFTSRSSLGSLTLTIRTMTDRLKVSSKVANFVGSIGAVMNMDACGGIFPAMVAVFAANAFGIELTIIQYFLIIVVSIIASIGSAGVPMGATAFTIITLTTVGLPVEAVGLVAGVDFIVDMFRTGTNVTGDMMTSVVVGDKLGEFDRESFNSQDFSNSVIT